MQIFKDKNTDRLKLSINGKNIIDWFKEKYQELKQAVKPHIKPSTKSQIGKSKDKEIITAVYQIFSTFDALSAIIWNISLKPKD